MINVLTYHKKNCYSKNHFAPYSSHNFFIHRMEGDDLSVVGQSERVVFFWGGFEALRHFCRENLLTGRSVDAISGQNNVIPKGYFPLVSVG